MTDDVYTFSASYRNFLLGEGGGDLSCGGGGRRGMCSLLCEA